MRTENPPLVVDITPLAEEAALGARWRALESQADGGFFRSWAFVQCQSRLCAAPQLLSVRQGGEDLALALLSQDRGRILIGETGKAAHDALFIEHNGVLMRRGAEALLPQVLAQLCRSRPVVMSGVDAQHLAAARTAGRAVIDAERFAPHVVLSGLQGPFLLSVSANTRGQINRSMRLYGPGLCIERAADADTALAWFAGLVRLHQARWQAEGKAGAFADAGLLRFHQALIAAAQPLGQADLLRVSAGGADIGYLYNFCHGGRVLAYQSGFAPAANARMKPGLVCHALAIEHYRSAGMGLYDFLAGPARYKTSLAAEAGAPLYWLTLYARHSPRGYAAATRRFLAGSVGARLSAWRSATARRSPGG